jgi:hypothetical protein
MIPKMVCIFLFSVLFFISSASVQTKNVLFLGLFNQKGEHVESSVEQALRNELSADSKFRLVSATETQIHLRELERLGTTPLERFVPPKTRIGDSTIVIWGVVKESSIRPRHFMLLWGKADAVLTIDIFIGEFKNNVFYYRGELTAQASKFKGFLHLGSAQKKVHISVADRLELTGQLQSQMVRSVSDIFYLVFNSMNESAKHEGAQEPGLRNDTLPEEHRIPSVADMFAEPAADMMEDAENSEPRQEEPDSGMEAAVTVE